MKFFLTYCLILFCIGSIYSQKFEGYVVTTSNDTIKCKFFVETNMFDSTMFYANSVRDRVKIVDKKGEKIKYEPSQLVSFLIKGTKFGDFKFVSFKEDNYKFFYHEIVVGKISLYRLYQADIYSGGPNSGYRDYVFKDGVLSKMDILSYRKKLGALIKDYPQLYQKWMDSDNYYETEQADEVVKLYNDYYLDKK